MITPYYKESIDVIRRCHYSVKQQTHKNTTHLLVSDGKHNSLIAGWKGEYFSLPESHNDAGATPRALAAISAFSRGYDAVGFIDADNWIDPTHVEKMIETMQNANAQGAIATRRIHNLDGKEMYVDRVESNGTNMVDTNCMFLSKAALHLMTYWVVEQGQRLWSDRYFWSAVQKSGLRIASCLEPTVAYCSKWAWHYEYAGLEPPPDSVWINKDESGNLSFLLHKDTKFYTRIQNSTEGYNKGTV